MLTPGELADIKAQAQTGSYTVNGNAEIADCILAFSFGFIKRGTIHMPGLSNEQLARYIKRYFDSLPKILQCEVADALAEPEIYRIEGHSIPGEYLHTQQVARQASMIMRRKQWKIAVIVAHPFHMPRCVAVCQKLGIKTISPPGLETIAFDPKSEQEWTRSSSAWVRREPETLDEFNQRGWI